MVDRPPETERDLTYPEAAELAFRLHAARRLEEAEKLYRTLLSADPDDANVKHYLGVLMHQIGRHAESARLIEESLAADASVAAWHNNHGNVLLDSERFEDAAAAYQRCAELDPGNVEVLSNLGQMYRSLERYEEAEAMLKRALAAQPDFITAHFNLTTVYWQMGRFEDAHLQTVTALNLFPRDTRIRQMLGQLYGMVGRLDKAAEIYREWLEHEPDNLDARHHLAACTGVDVPERADDHYVERLFDRFADTFDAKLGVLDYRAPQLVGEAIGRLLPEPGNTLRILDAGCGTGLCAPHLAPYARVLVGVDLSANMIELARSRKLYTELVKSELVGFLESVRDPYDVIVSADTLCYFGRLDAMAAAARRSLNDGGLLIFTVEARTEGADYHLHPHGRYSHRSDYIRAVLDRAAFTVREVADATLRSEGGRPVAGFVVVAEAA